MMDTLIGFFTNTHAAGPLDILVNVVLSAILSGLIYIVYVRFGNTLSNRRQFGHSFLLITVCTALIISLIRSSIALSLGLVGALSIVRFRTAVKEPEELTYLFFCIAVGLGYGANERLITTAASLLILLVLVVRGFVTRRTISRDYNISITSSVLNLKEITSLLRPHCSELSLRRLDQREQSADLLLRVGFDKSSDLNTCLDVLCEKDPDIRVTFLDNRA